MLRVKMKVRRTIDKETPGLGQRIREARVADGRPLEVICALAGLSRVHWYDIESEKVRNALPEETLRKIEKVLDVDFEVNFDT
ncbi:transcriptional regulator (plasmid) [Calothrix sp. NIES-4071]|nr:transcriptional regulator [Calothrix sp. NIES-4071]BAZ64948.1 transcriptional regulator [Calothrix sp. NIES-4105]